MTRSWVSQATRTRLAPTALVEHQLGQLLDRMAAGERRAFWLAVAIMDSKVTVASALDALAGSHPLVAAPPPPPPGRPEPKLNGRVRLCESCGRPLPDQTTGRPRRFHDACRPARRAQLRSLPLP